MDRNIEDLLGPGSYSRIRRKAHYTRQHVSRVLRGIGGTSPECVERIANATDLETSTVWQFIKMKRAMRQRKESYGDS